MLYGCDITQYLSAMGKEEVESKVYEKLGE